MHIKCLGWAWLTEQQILSQWLARDIGERWGLLRPKATMTKRAYFDLPSARQFAQLDNRLFRRLAALHMLQRDVRLPRPMTLLTSDAEHVVCLVVAINYAGGRARLESGGMALKAAGRHRPAEL